jgi:hypothetical protein
MAHSVPPTHAVMTRPYPWEKSYPPGVKWDVPLRIGTLNELLSEALSAYGPRAMLTYGARTIRPPRG